MTKTQGTLDALVERYFGETTDVQALSLETAALVHPIAYRAACGMNLDGPDAEEVAQEVATKFVKRLESGERPRGNPEALLWRMAENRSRDVHRARKRQTQGKQRLGLELTATADVAPDAETVWLTRERQVRVEEIVREVLKEAPASYQNAIRSHYLEGVPVEELANANYAELVVAGEVDERDPASVREAERRARNRADQHLKRGRDWLRMRLHEQLREGGRVNGLILVDLDNVLNGLRGEDALETFTRRACERRGPVAGSWSVVFALNTAAVTGYALTFEGLRDAGRALGAAAGDPQPTVEIGLALTMPQTADVLLARLAREAPEAGAAGPYHHAIVCTADVGLAESLGSVLYVRAGGTGWRETRDDGWLGREWRMAEGGRPVVRKFADGALRLARHSQPVLDHHTVCVGSGMDDWAATRSMDVEPGSDLRKLACQLDERPWLLSQVGATRKSVRGVARLSRLPSDPPPLLGSVAPDEELEVRGTAPRPTSAHEPSAASVGIGAVRFRGTGATVASRLSPTVLASSGTTHRVDFLGVVVPAALQQLKFNVPLGDATVLVRLSHRGDDLVAKVQHSSVTQPQAWWLTGATTVKSEHRSPNGSLLPKSISVTAAPVRPSAQFAAQLALVSPVRDGEELRLEHDVAAGTIGVGWTQPSCGKSRPMAVFSHSRPLRGGDKLCVTPIQLRRRLGPLARAPEALWSLPVVVPQ